MFIHPWQETLTVVHAAVTSETSQIKSSAVFLSEIHGIISKCLNFIILVD